MCGIIGIHFKNPRNIGVNREKLEDFVDEMLCGIEHRGRHATGLLTISDRGKPDLVKADVQASMFINWRNPIPKRVRTILGHTRYATQGSPMVLDNNHPVQFDSCFAIHNGHIANDSELFEEHSLERRAEVDSEIIPALFHKFGLDKAHLALQELEGGFATAIVDPVRFPNMTILAKGWNSPAEVLETKQAVIWASEANVIQDACEKVLGFRPAYSKIESLHAGDILLMEGETVEKLEFKVKSRTWKPQPRTDGKEDSCPTVSSPKALPSVSSSRTGKLYDECASCGCARLWHGSGKDFTGCCTHKQLGSNKLCKCVMWKEPQEASPVRPLRPDEVAKTRNAWEYCDGCGRKFYVGDLKIIGTTYLCPNLCAKDPQLVSDAERKEGVAPPQKPQKESVSLRKRAEDVLLVAQLAEAEGGGEGSPGSYAYNAREEAVNVHVCEMAAEKTGMAATYIDWLVNDCKTEWVQADGTGYLEEARKMAGKAYFDAWNAIDDEIEDIENARFQENLRGSEDNREPCECGYFDKTWQHACLTRKPEEECGVVVEAAERFMGVPA